MSRPLKACRSRRGTAQRLGLSGVILTGLSIALVAAAAAQPAGYQLLTNSTAGYQLAVPDGWQTDSTTGSAGLLASSPDGTELAYVTVEAAPAVGTGATSQEILQGITQGALGVRASDSGYQVVQAATGASVPGADGAESGVVSYSGGSSGPMDEYILTAVSGLTGYVLTVDLPANAPNAAAVAMTILQSFALTGSSGASSGS